ncbi:metalloregulator ArsR/SmtB family transcription factor [Nostocoides sp. F2B08]|uniref:ArsR/SmtB family transcription factor n=1 Tax=Nostocoides sp. F2B08 TaxID=2653936 RepID=UPI0012631743|nr:metalloregulator ArsR/SmtB family transcription factor [Tetrasphaera sp. F2B08]KAB7743273.1 metalloregulator ArsR/SmtB family transcription factor [Tetrasphaera sp. F2B08]
MDVFTAIADPVRRSLLEDLARDGATRVVDLSRGRGISRPAVSRHLRVLTAAGLVRATDRGRERHFELVTEPLEQVDRWTSALRSAPPPPVAEHALDALELEVRRTVRERAGSTGTGPPHTASEPSPAQSGESA